MATYTRYILPSLRYHLAVHNIHQTHLDQLDMLAQKYLKVWLAIPARGCTSQGIFNPYLLGVKPVSQLYQEAHIGSYINSKLVADPTVKEALSCAEEREGQWVHKSSTINQCKAIFEQLKEDCFIPTSENTQKYEAACRL